MVEPTAGKGEGAESVSLDFLAGVLFFGAAAAVFGGPLVLGTAFGTAFFLAEGAAVASGALRFRSSIGMVTRQGECCEMGWKWGRGEGVEMSRMPSVHPLRVRV